MKALIIGSGGREHAIAWKIAQSDKVSEVHCAPGNPGTASLGINVDIAVDDIEALVAYAKDKSIDLTVVGPEYPLSLGIVDAFETAGLRVFGPSKEASQMESSKAFAKEIMIAAGVPTAAYKKCTSEEEARAYCAEQGAPLVLKLDGLAAGKGVFVCMTENQIEEALGEIFKDSKECELVIEEFLEGEEASYIAACADDIMVPFASSHDYKRIFENDEGPNTGGMGTVSPTPHLNSEQENWANESVMKPVLEELSKRGIPFKGFLYAGLMISPSGDIKVLEFNARLGDPETQVLLRRLNSDLFELLYDLSGDSAASATELAWSDEVASCVIMASEGYPASSSKGDTIQGVEEANSASNTVVFHAGTSIVKGSLATAGGRVLAVTATGPNLSSALEDTYQAVDKISFKGSQYRRDIGK